MHSRKFRSRLAVSAAMLALLLAAPGGFAAEFGRLKVTGEARLRYESLDGQFQAGFTGSDQELVFRTLVLGEIDLGWLHPGLEFQDSRSYFDDAGSPISNSDVDPLDILQAYLRFGGIDVFGWDASLKLGRQTLGIGSQRLVERVEMTNVIKAYTGIYWRAENARGDELHAFYSAPVGRLPADPQRLIDNRLVWDETEWGRRFWGVHYRRKDGLGDLLPGVWLEAYVYGLHENDTARVPTPNRDYFEPGFRIFRGTGTGPFDLEVEATFRTGSRRLTSNPADVTDLDVSAWRLHAQIGYTFEHPWSPRIAFEYDFASGDEDPDDLDFERYESLFGGRRTDLGHTGILGLLSPSNISTPGMRVEVSPNPRVDARLGYKFARLDEPRDAWASAGVRDVSGGSGREIGHIIDARARYWIVQDSLRAETGGAVLFNGRFPREAPNATGEGNTMYGYFQLVQTF